MLAEAAIPLLSSLTTFFFDDSNFRGRMKTPVQLEGLERVYAGSYASMP